MLVISRKYGSGMTVGHPYRRHHYHSGEGIFDFGKILLKKALNSNLLKRASKAINSELGQTAISAVKRAARSELGQELKQKAISAVQEKALDALDSGSKSLPSGIKKAARSDLGQMLQKKIVSEVGKRSRDLGGATETAFSRLGIAEPSSSHPPTKKKKRKQQQQRKQRKGVKRKGKGGGTVGGALVYPQGLIDQFVGNGSGILLE